MAAGASAPGWRLLALAAAVAASSPAAGAIALALAPSHATLGVATPMLLAGGVSTGPVTLVGSQATSAVSSISGLGGTRTHASVLEVGSGSAAPQSVTVRLATASGCADIRRATIDLAGAPQLDIRNSPAPCGLTATPTAVTLSPGGRLTVGGTFHMTAGRTATLSLVLESTTTSIVLRESWTLVLVG